MVTFFAIAIAINLILGALLAVWAMRQWRLRSLQAAPAAPEQQDTSGPGTKPT